MAEVGCYVLHLYCDHPEHSARAAVWMRARHEDYVRRNEYTGPTLAAARRAARADGWAPGREVTCPRCRLPRRYSRPLAPS
jgi:hypothetical protein